MATNNTKRSVIKWVRDGIKSKYKKGTCCAVCNTEEKLEFHHYNTVALLVTNYIENTGVQVDTKEQILEMREAFYQEYEYEMVEDGVTLCESHHRLLHKIYGVEPKLETATKQRLWVEKQHEKFLAKKSGTYMESLPASLTQYCVDAVPLTNFLTR